MCFFFKHKTAYEMRISDWSSDVCSSDLGGRFGCTHRDTTGSRAYGRQVRERFSGHGRRSSQRRQGPALRLYGNIGHGDALQKRGAASLRFLRAYWLRQQGYRSSRSRTNRRADRPVGDAPRRAGAPAADYVRTRPRSREDTADLGITSVWTSASAAARRSSMATDTVWATALRLPSLAQACHSPSRPVIRPGFMQLAPASPTTMKTENNRSGQEG